MVLSKVRLWADFFERWSCTEIQQSAPTVFYKELCVENWGRSDTYAMKPLLVEGSGIEAAVRAAVRDADSSAPEGSALFSGVG